MSVTIRINGDPNPKNQLNLTNRNFATLWAALGLEHEPVGEIDPRPVAERCRSTPPELLVRASRTEAGNGPTLVDCGISYRQAARYLAILNLLANVAARREEKLIWY